MHRTMNLKSILLVSATYCDHLQGGVLCNYAGHSSAYRCILVHTDAYRCILIHTGAYWCILVHIGAYWCILVHTGAY
jgi:hypothetical protein